MMNQEKIFVLYLSKYGIFMHFSDNSGKYCLQIERLRDGFTLPVTITHAKITVSKHWYSFCAVQLK
jgi:hypothetical protein